LANADQATAPASRLARLLAYLERDPGNLQLTADAAAAAADEQAWDSVSELVARHAALAPLTPALLNLAAMAAMAQQRYTEAAAGFERLIAEHGDAPVLRFNLAWARAMMADYGAAEALLDDAALDASPRAPALKIRMLHHLERYQDGLAVGEQLAQRFPDNGALMGALSVLAMDADESALARSYAERAGDDPDGTATRALLMLDDADPEHALALFDRAVAAAPHNPRAWIGRGLSLLADGDATSAATDLGRGAALFGDHLGSWIAAGWAHYVAGDLAASRADFETALALDDGFAETHGGLAVLDIAAGDVESAKRRTAIALRLDRACFAAALAQSMLLDQAGKADAAQQIRDRALHHPIGSDGRTIANAIAGLTRRGGPRRG